MLGFLVYPTSAGFPILNQPARIILMSHAFAACLVFMQSFVKPVVTSPWGVFCLLTDTGIRAFYNSTGMSTWSHNHLDRFILGAQASKKVTFQMDGGGARL